MIELLVYKYNDWDGEPIGQLPVRLKPMFLEELKANGGGSFDLPLDVARSLPNPELLEYRNLVKIRVDGNTIGGFMIGKQNDDPITQEEAVGEKKAIAGEGLKIILDDAAVLPKGGLKRASSTKRAFNFSSEEGAWYNPASWINPFNLGQIHTKPNGAWGAFPEEFPSNTAAQWIWGTPYASQMPLGTCYFRYKFTVIAETQYALYAACDNYLGIWLNGEHLATSDPQNWDAWHKATRVTFTLPPGDHVLGFTGANASSSTGVISGPAALVMALMRVDGDNETLVGKSGTGNWKVLPYPTQAPAWSTGEVVLKLLQEAEDFGVFFPTWFTTTFTATHDSYGNPWDGALDWIFDVGESYTSVVQKLEELLCDMWIDPSDMTINLVNKRGVDRSVTKFDVDGITILEAPLKFEKGKNLRKASTAGVGKMKNHLLIRTEAGWMLEDNEYDPGTLKYGKLMAKLDTNASEALSKQLAQLVFAERGTAEEGASYEVIVTDGFVPWVDYFPGDWVLAPNKDGISVKRRIMSISLEETETGAALYTMEFDTIFRDTSDRVNRFMSKTGGGSLGTSYSNAGATPPSAGGPIVIPPGPVILTLPEAPDGLAATSEGSWTSDGMRAVSTVSLTWLPVTTNTDGSATVPSYYEVWGFVTSEPDSLNLLALVPTAEAVIPGLQPDTNWTFRVRAFNDASRSGQFSTDITHTTLGPTTPMAAPSMPVLSSQLGLLVVDWDGFINTSVSPPPQFRYTRVEASLNNGLFWFNTGATFPRGGGSVSIPNFNVGATVDVRLIAIDGLGIESDPSLSAEITITGVDLGDLDQDVTDAIEAAEDAANAARESINMLGDPSFELNTYEYWSWEGIGVTNTNTNPRTGERNLEITAKSFAYIPFRYNNAIPCDPGETYQVRMYVKVADTGVENYIADALQIRIWYSSTEDFATTFSETIGGTISLDSGEYTLTVADWVVPPGIYYFKPYFQMTDIDSDNIYYVDDIRVVQKVGTLLVVDGAIVADHLAAGSVTTLALQAGSVVAEKIQAGAVIAGKIAADAVTANEIAAGSIETNHILAGAIETNHLSPGVGGELDISANDSVTIIAGQIDEVQGSVNDTQDNLEEMQTYYTFGVDGAVVSTPASPFAVAIRNDRIEMLENGNVVSYWNSGQMVVSQFVGEKVILGNHQLEKYSDGTVVRAL